MSRTVVLIELYWCRDKDPRVPLGHASLLAALREAGTTDVRSIVAPVNRAGVDPGALAGAIMEQIADVEPSNVDVAIGAYVWAEPIVQKLLPALRASGFQGRIVLGGPQISYTRRGLEQLYPDADAFVRGYGERALAQLVATSGRPHIRGVHYAGAPDLGEQAEPELATLPSPWLTGVIPLEGQAFVRWETQRGCPFRCSFCQHREPGARLARTDIPMGRLRREIQTFCEAGVTDIAVLDPIFNNGPRAIEILSEFERRQYRGRLSLQCRAEMVTRPFVDAAARLNTTLEFGLQTIHPKEGRAVKRQNNIRRIDEALAWVRRAGIQHEVSLIFGLPEQTLSSFLETVSWCLERRVPVIRAFPLMLLRGTQLDDDQRRWNLRESATTMPMVISSTTFDEGDWIEMTKVAHALERTRGRHPRHLTGLLLEVDPADEVQLLRWTPAPTTRRPSPGTAIAAVNSDMARAV